MYYTRFLKPMATVWKVGVDAKEKASEGLGHAARGGRDLLSAAQESVGPSLSKASEALRGTAQAIPGAIEGAAGGAKSTLISHWERLKNKVEGWRK